MTLLTTDEYRELHSTALDEDALQLLLDAAEADIIDFTGSEDGTVVEWFDGGQQVIALSRRADTITSIIENPRWGGGTPTTLAVDDYLLDPTGLLLYRQVGGTNARYHWWGRVAVTYAGSDTEAQRKVVQSDLVYLAETYSPNLTSETVGSWTQQYRQAMTAKSAERDDILSALTLRGRMRVVGG